MYFILMYIHIIYVHVGFFYFTVGNVSPKYRSLLKAINLVALIKRKWIKQYSMNAILEPIVNDIKKLVSLRYLIVCKYSFCVSGLHTFCKL